MPVLVIGLMDSDLKFAELDSPGGCPFGKIAKYSYYPCTRKQITIQLRFCKLILYKSADAFSI